MGIEVELYGDVEDDVVIGFSFEMVRVIFEIILVSGKSVLSIVDVVLCMYLCDKFFYFDVVCIDVLDGC